MRIARCASCERGRVTVALAEAVLEDERAHAQRVQPLGDLLALVVGGHHPVAAAGADDDRRAGRPVGGSEVDGDLRLVDGLVADRSRRPVRPQQVELAVAVRGVHRGDGVGRRGGRLGKGASGQERRHRQRDRGEPPPHGAGCRPGHSRPPLDVPARCSRPSGSELPQVVVRVLVGESAPLRSARQRPEQRVDGPGPRSEPAAEARPSAIPRPLLVHDRRGTPSSSGAAGAPFGKGKTYRLRCFRGNTAKARLPRLTGSSP